MVPNRRQIALLAAALLFGCRSQPAAVDAPPEGGAAVAQSSASLAPAANSSPPRTEQPDAGDGLMVFTVSVAHFAKDNLDECVDLTFRTSNPDGGKKLKETFGKDKETTLLPATCADAFKDRLVLATCTAEVSQPRGKADAGPTDGGADRGSISFVSRYYRFETVVNSDAFMKQCFESQGHWDALRRDSEEFQRAQRDSHARKLEGLVK